MEVDDGDTGTIAVMQGPVDAWEDARKYAEERGKDQDWCHVIENGQSEVC